MNVLRSEIRSKIYFDYDESRKTTNAIELKASIEDARQLNFKEHFQPLILMI